MAKTLTLGDVRAYFCVPKWTPDISAIGQLIYASDNINIYPVKVENGNPATQEEMSRQWPQQVEAGFNNILYVSEDGMLLRWPDPPPKPK